MTDPERRPYDWAIDDTQPFAEDDFEIPDDPVVRRISPAAIGGIVLVGASLLTNVVVTVKEYRASRETCDAPPTEAVVAVQRLFTQPRDVQSMPFVWDGLSFKKVEYDKTIQNMQEIEPGTKEKFNQIVAEANSFTGLYGVTISYGDKNEETEDGWKQPNDKLLKTEKAADAVDNIVEGISNLPTEYIKLAGLKRIVLRYKKFDKNDAEVSAFVPGEGKHTKDSMYVNLAYSGDTEMVSHETYHILDNRQCGIIGSRNDKAFKSLNNEDVYNPEKRSDLYALFDENQTNALNSLDFKIQNSSYYGRQKEVENLKQKALSILRKTAVVRDHGFDSAMEDKAGIAELIGDPEKLSIPLDTSIPTLRKKTLFLMARLYTKLPNYVRYLAETTRPINRLGYFR